MLPLTAKIDNNSRFRLLQLTPKLEASLREGTLTFRSAKGGSKVVLTTHDSSHAVRRLKQSNTLLLATPKPIELEVFASAFDLLETVEFKGGDIDWSTFPLYEGHKKFNCHELAETESVQPEWACSPAEFKNALQQYPAVELDSTVYRVSPSVVHDVVVDIVSAMVERGDVDLASGLSGLELQSGEPPYIVEAVFNKFWQVSDGGGAAAAVDKDALSAWIGIYVLQNSGGKSGMDKTQFLKEWKLDLPLQLRTDLDLLAGSAVETRPNWVQYIDANALSSDARARFEDLFALKKEWDLNEISPFIQSLVPSSQKLDNWILKFARRRAQGKRVVVSPIRR